MALRVGMDLILGYLARAAAEEEEQTRAPIKVVAAANGMAF